MGVIQEEDESISISQIEDLNYGINDDFDDIEVESEVSQANHLQEIRDRLEESPDQHLTVKQVDENYLKWKNR